MYIDLTNMKWYFKNIKLIFRLCTSQIKIRNQDSLTTRFAILIKTPAASRTGGHLCGTGGR